MNTPHTRVMILGANGRFGSEAVKAFAAAGWQVVAQHRAGHKPEFPAGVSTLVCDATDSRALIAAADGISVIVNALNPDYAKWDSLVPPISASVLALARHTGAMLMLPGNVYNFGSSMPASLREDTPQHPDTGHGKVRLALEEAMKAAQGVDSVVIRAGDYFGGTRTGTWLDLTMARSLRAGKLAYPGPRDTVHAWAYLPDLAKSFVMVAAKRASLSGFKVFHFGGHAVTGNQFHAALEKALRRQLKATTVPWWLMRCIAVFSPIVAAVVEMRYLWDRPHALDDSRLRAFIGTVPSTPLHEALAQTLKDSPAISTGGKER